MDELNDTQQVEVGDQQYTGDLSDLVQDEPAVEAAPSGETFEQETAPEPEPESKPNIPHPQAGRQGASVGPNVDRDTNFSDPFKGTSWGN